MAHQHDNHPLKGTQILSSLTDITGMRRERALVIGPVLWHQGPRLGIENAATFNDTSDVEPVTEPL